MSLVKFNMIIVTDKEGGVSKNNTLPWTAKSQYRQELLNAANLTLQTQDPSEYNAVIMGRKTWDSLDAYLKPLPNQLNIILTRNSEKFKKNNPDVEGNPFVHIESSLDNALAFVNAKRGIEKTWVIGGYEVYKEALNHTQLNAIYRVIIPENFECDVKIDWDAERMVPVSKVSPPDNLHVEPSAEVIKYYKTKPENIVGYLKNL